MRTGREVENSHEKFRGPWSAKPDWNKPWWPMPKVLALGEVGRRIAASSG